MCVKELCDYLFVQSEVLSPQAHYSNPEPTVGAGRAHFRSQWGKWGKSASHLHSSHTPLTTSVPLLLRWLWLGSPSLLRDRVKCLFSFSFIFISWRLITLQYCSGFCHTLTWVSHGFTCVPIPIPPPTSLSTRSLWVFPVHRVRALVSCIQPGLVICFILDNIHVLMLFSWNIPPSPSPTESKSLFCTSV